MASSFCSSLISIVAIVCLLCKCCFSAPHPCCPGSQHVVSMMKDHTGTFSASMPKSSLCLSAERVAAAVENQLKTIWCPGNGGQTLINEINAAQSSSDECARSLGFVRAMFEIAASAASHVGANAELANLAVQFREQVGTIDTNCAALGIHVGQISLGTPKGDHPQVHDSESVLSNPGTSGSHKRI
uniref:Putative gland protein G16B09 n=1 Tax=Heterodera glycines TaxID=51029 RepID=Q86M77_HETGL|nr:putative gland protein G16B09 [Heterodera glycines]